MQRTFAVLTLCLVIGPPLFAQSPIEPPLQVASQSPLQSLRLTLLPVVPAELRKGEMRVAVSETWTKVWINDRPDMLLDYEALDSRLNASWALSTLTQLQLEVDGRSRFGGLLDPLIQNVHRLIGNGLNGRDTVPRDSVNIEVRDPNSGRLLMSRHYGGPFARGVAITMTQTRPSQWGRLAYAATVRVPVRNTPEDGTSGADLGLSGAWSRNIRGRSVHLGAGITRFGTNLLEGVPAERLQRTGFAAVVQPLTRRVDLIAQYLFNEGVAKSGALTRNAHELTVGGRVRIGDRSAVEFGLLENLLTDRNGPDFGIHFGIVRRSR